MGYDVEQTKPVSKPECQVCGETIDRADLVACQHCSTAHHRDCWRYNKGCSTFGCGSRACVIPSNTEDLLGFSKVQNTLEVSREWVISLPVGTRLWWLLMIMVLPVIIAFLAGLLASPLGEAIAVTVGSVAYMVSIVAIAMIKSKRIIYLDTGEIEPRLSLFGLDLTAEPEWLMPDDIIELHLVWQSWHSRQGLRGALHAQRTDGSRVLLFPQADETDETFRAMAERIAEIVDASIVEATGTLPPLVKEEHPRSLPSE